MQILMNTLPLLYVIISTIVQTLNQSSVITTETIIKAMLAEEEHCKQGVGLIMMFTQPSNPKNVQKLSNDKNEDKKDFTCYNCERPRHIKQNCWDKGGGTEGQAPWQK